VKDRLTIGMLGAQLVTKSDRWGTILRIAYELPGFYLPGHVNRIMCWQGADGKWGIMFAVGPGRASAAATEVN
jgi:hypothetical protein